MGINQTLFSKLPDAGFVFKFQNRSCNGCFVVWGRCGWKTDRYIHFSILWFRPLPFGYINRVCEPVINNIPFKQIGIDSNFKISYWSIETSLFRCLKVCICQDSTCVSIRFFQYNNRILRHGNHFSYMK